MSSNAACVQNLTPSPNFHPFRSTNSRFGDTMLSKIRNAPNDLTLTLSTYLSKACWIHCILTSEAQICIHFAVRPAISEIKGRFE